MKDGLMITPGYMGKDNSTVCPEEKESWKYWQAAIILSTASHKCFYMSIVSSEVK